jgi:small subunit ribosomal protein S4
VELIKDRTKPGWLQISSDKLEIKIMRLPEREDIQQPIREQLIVELYSK